MSRAATTGAREAAEADPPVASPTLSSVDLHAHSTASDGALAPAAVVELAARAGIRTLALTDHDTVAGLEEARGVAASAGVRLIDGVELGTVDARGRIDILAHFVDPEDPALRALLDAIREARDRRAEGMVARLRALGVPITLEAVRAFASGPTVARPHVALALVAAGAVPDVATAFRRYIGEDGPAYVARYKLTADEACAVVRAAGGVPVLAHPVPPRRGWLDPLGLRAVLPGLRDAGLGGLECYYPGYAPRVSRWLVGLAERNGLVPTGGSDFHGPWRPGNPLGGAAVPDDVTERLEAARW